MSLHGSTGWFPPVWGQRSPTVSVIVCAPASLAVVVEKLSYQGNPFCTLYCHPLHNVTHSEWASPPYPDLPSHVDKGTPRIADETSYNVCYPTIHNTWWRYWNQRELEYLVDIITWLAKAENFNTCKVSSNTPGAGLTLTNNITRPCPAQWPLPTKKFWNSWVNLLSLNGTIRRSPFLQCREQTRWM